MVEEKRNEYVNNSDPVRQSYAVPVSIVIAGGLIAIALFFGSDANTVPVVKTDDNVQPTQQTPPVGNTNAVKEVTTADHIKGNIDAPVKIIEYSDYECPFCKRFHNTMNEIIDKYGDSGEVAWIYRHFPLDQLHPKNARIVASASECVNELSGNDAFWLFSDRWFELTLTNDRTNLEIVLPQIYNEIGVDRGKVEACIASGKYDQHIQDDFNNAVATGGRGTPWSVVVGSDGKTYPLNGAQTIASVEQLIRIANVEN